MVRGHERDGGPARVEASGTTDAVQVRLGRLGHVVVDREVDLLHVDAARVQVADDQDADVVALELLVDLQPLLDVQAGRGELRRDAGLREQLGERLGALRALHEHDALVEPHVVDDLLQLAVLVLLLEGNLVLLEPVQGQLVVGDHDLLEAFLQVLDADFLLLLGHGGAEHHHLLVLRRLQEHGLHLLAHLHVPVAVADNVVALVHHKVLHVAEVDLPAQRAQSSRSADDDCRTFGFNFSLMQ